VGVAAQLETALDQSAAAFATDVLLYETPALQKVPSTVYKFPDMRVAVRQMYEKGVGARKLWIGDGDGTDGDGADHTYGLVNLAAFLAQSMKETIKYDACDENSWDLVAGRYPASNACGQLGQSYQDYKCSAAEAHMQCEVDPTLEITATTNAKWYGAPGPMKCGPKTKLPAPGYWDYRAECNKPWANPPEHCTEYAGQKAGKWMTGVSAANTAGRTDVEGCCYWGRGVIQTTGVCNFGKLNYHLGKRAAREGRPSAYPDIDFCKEPDAICASTQHPELKWIAGLFYWTESVQTYDVGGWNYIAELRRFVNGGMRDEAFINAVSGIVNRGCHNPPCATGALDGGPERAGNFRTVLRAMGLKK
jgi:predicted chitinase